MHSHPRTLFNNCLYPLGTTDYMDRFIDEQDPSRDRSSSPNFYSLMFGGQDGGRKGLSLHPGAGKSNITHGDSNGAANEGPLDISAANVPTSTATSNSSGILWSKFHTLCTENNFKNSIF